MDNVMEKIVLELSHEKYVEYDITRILNKYEKKEYAGLNYSDTRGVEDGICIRVLDSQNRFAQFSYNNSMDIKDLVNRIDAILSLASSEEWRHLYDKQMQYADDEELYIYCADFKKTYNNIELRNIIPFIKEKGIIPQNALLIYVEEEVHYYNPLIGMRGYKKNYGTLSFVVSIIGSDRKLHTCIQSKDLTVKEHITSNSICNDILQEIEIYTMQKTITMQSGAYNIVFSKTFFYYLFINYYVNDFYHHRVIRNQYSGNINLSDDGKLPNGYGTRPFDYEGVGAEKTNLIQAGRKIGSLVPLFQASKYNLRSTGNMHKEFYYSKPKLEFSNLVFEIIPNENNNKKYIYVNTSGTGEFTDIYASSFNVLVDKGGKIPLSNLYIKLDYKKLFSNVSAAPGWNHIMGIYYPNIVFNDVEVFFS